VRGRDCPRWVMMRRSVGQLGGAGVSCGQLHKVGIGEIAVAEAAILNVVPHPVFKLDTPLHFIVEWRRLGSFCGKDCEGEFSWFECVEDTQYYFKVGACGYVTFKADIAALWFWSDVYGHVFSQTAIFMFILQDSIH